MATVSFQQGVNGYAGTADTMLRESRPSSSYATVTYVNVDGVDSEGKMRDGLLYFDNLFGSGPGQIPYGATITSATLTLEVNDGTKDGLSFHRMLIDWTRISTWTWDSFGSGIQYDNTEAAAPADLTMGTLAAGLQNLDVTQSLQAWANGEDNYGWAIKTKGSDGWDFTSSEGAVKPKLTVTYTTDTTTPPAAGISIVQSNGSTQVTEGGGTDTFTIALSSAPTANVVITINNTADVVGSPTTLTFTSANWNTPQMVTVSAVDDSLVEGPETSNLTFSVSSADTRYNNFSTAPLAVAVTDNDGPPAAPPVISIGSATAAENAGAITFTVRLDKAASQSVTVNYTTADGTAKVGSDYISKSGTVTFAAGQTEQAITISLVDDALPESTETFSVNLASPTNATLGTSTGTGTITDNDSTTPPSSNPTVVAIHNTTLYKAGDPSGYGCSDPSGLAYVPGLDLIFIADSEHDESPFFSTTNLFAVRPDGTHVASYSLTSFCKEPTGLAYNPKNGYLYITDDQSGKVFWVDPRNPSVKIGEFSVKSLGFTDAEDPKFDPVTGHMYMLNGLAHTSTDNSLVEMTDTGKVVRSITLPSVITDAEALAYDSANDVFYVASGATRGTIFRVSSEGQLLATISLLDEKIYRNEMNGGKPKIKGLELAPSSNPNDGNKLSLYAADYGTDQYSDGRLIEVDLGTGWLIT